MGDEMSITHIPRDTPMIEFGVDYRTKWPDHRKISYLEKLASSMNHGAKLIQRERNDLLGQMVVMEAQLVAAQKAYEIQKAITERTITDTNAERQNLLAEISELRKMLMDGSNN